MKLLSVNTGLPKTYDYDGKEVVTSIFKTAVAGKRQVSTFNIEGDGQSDLVHHGGELKAVYSYDHSYYESWKKVLERTDWPFGLFGENLTTSGLRDDIVHVGDIFKAGTVYLKAVQPRFPCYKLNIRFGLPDMLQRFMQHGKHGIYFKVEQEGILETGDEITMVQKSKHAITIADYAACYYNKGTNREILEKILAIDFLPERHRKVFESFR